MTTTYSYSRELPNGGGTKYLFDLPTLAAARRAVFFAMVDNGYAGRKAAATLARTLAPGGACTVAGVRYTINKHTTTTRGQES